MFYTKILFARALIISVPIMEKMASTCLVPWMHVVESGAHLIQPVIQWLGYINPVRNDVWITRLVTGYRGAQTASVIGGSCCVSWAADTCRNMSAWLHGGKGD